MKHSPGRRLLGALLVATVATVASGLFYPGGASKREPDTSGYSLTGNYFSDLGMTVSYSGETNIAGAGLFLIGCLAFGFAARQVSMATARGSHERAFRDANDRAPGVLRDPIEASEGTQADVGGSLPRERTAPGGLGAALTRAVGIAAAAGFALTGLTPKNLLFHVHNWVSYGAFLALLILWVLAVLRFPSGPLRRLSVAMVAVSALYLAVLFLRPGWELPAGWKLQVVAQKAVVLFNWLAFLATGLVLVRSDVSRETDA